MKRYILIIALAVSAFACKKQEIPTFGEERFIHFASDTTKKMILSFAVMPGVTEYDLGVPLTMIGQLQSEALNYEVSVVTSGPNKTTLSDQSYDLPANPTFKAGQYADTLWVKLYRTAELEGHEFKLTLQLASNANYTANYRLHSYKEIFVSDKLVRPEWWTTAFANTYLGPYSDNKYLAFIEATGENDLTGLSPLDLGSYVRMFVYWLRAKDAAGETVYESDNTTKVLDSITYANV